MKYAIALALALTLNATANLMMKFGVNRFKATGVTLSQGFMPVGSALATNWVLILGLVCFATNVIFYGYALSGIRISIAYPIMFSGGVAIIALVAWKYLGETLSPAAWLGIILILVGVYLVAREMRPDLGT
jgi:multidrug transporter EmrE-like cation transporter